MTLDQKQWSQERELLEDVFQKAMSRAESGSTQYGPFSFLDKDQVEDIEEELLDVIVYASFWIAKIRRLQDGIIKDRD